MVNILISGSRNGWSYKEFEEKLLSLYKPEELGTMIFGCAAGVDFFAKKFCRKYNITFEEYKADWENKGKTAGALRNIDMGDRIKELGGKLIAFRYDFSSGTSHMIKYSRTLGIDVRVFDKSSFTF